ncbi:hypothetical protein EB230_31340 [Mesorhizobium sp. NZP2234]|nr:hypothetical protein EB230_31340 [Mesorhizobium sp. NZP2234]
MQLRPIRLLRKPAKQVSLLAFNLDREHERLGPGVFLHAQILNLPSPFQFFVVNVGAAAVPQALAI